MLIQRLTITTEGMVFATFYDKNIHKIIIKLEDDREREIELDEKMSEIDIYYDISKDITISFYGNMNDLLFSHTIDKYIDYYKPHCKYKIWKQTDYKSKVSVYTLLESKD